ncbi:MAG: MYXO-CTERM sorting domain-containing protein [Sandaracinaceae bacterium]
MFFSEVANGSCLIDVSGGALTLRNIRYDGVETDSFTLIDGDGIFLVRPVGGETYLAGSDVDIVWTSSGTSGQVRLEYSLDDGGTFSPIVATTDDDGSYTWTTPRRASTEVRIRVVDVEDASRFAESPRPFTLSAEADIEVVPPASVWEYADDGTEPPAAWTTETGGWASGLAQLGYGDGDEATVLEDVDPNHATYYFRRALTLDGVPTSARMRVTFDDGFAAFVNGTEVLARNVDDGLDHGTYASSSSDDNEVVEMDIDTGAFVEGENVIAVLVKQSGGSSSDLSFDLSLTARVQVMLDPDPPDAGAPRADAGPDASVPPGVDAGPARDAGSADAGDAPMEDGGCGCRAAPTHDPSLLWALPVAWLAGRRRRARRARRHSETRRS